MDSFILTKTNRLFWLGRYYKRVALTIQYVMNAYDETLETDDFDYITYCAKMGIPNVYEDVHDFFERYTFDVENIFSIRSSAEAMVGNGMVLRETIGSPTLSYIQMALYVMDEAHGKLNPDDSVGLAMQRVIDNIMAFRGCYDDYINDDVIRNIIKCGSSIECLSFMLRIDYRLDALDSELQKLMKRIPRSGLQTHPQPFQTLLRRANDGEAGGVTNQELLMALESLFIV